MDSSDNLGEIRIFISAVRSIISHPSNMTLNSNFVFILFLFLFNLFSLYRVSQKTWELSDEFDIIFVMN